jgi:DNA primase
MSRWIDFRELRSKLSFEAVLSKHGVEIKKKGIQHLGFCPLPGHKGEKRSPSFSANLEKGIFQCFGCGGKGNVLEFSALMQGVDVKNGQALRDVALSLQREFCPELEKHKKPKKGETAPSTQTEILPQGKAVSKVIVNAPLDFELKKLEPSHPYLDKRGFTKETIEHFGLGFCFKGLLAGRIAIPVHAPDGKLVGYCGRIVDDTKINEANPRYKFPPPRQRTGVTYEFHKSKLLYNAHRILKPVENLIVVEGFPSVWWSHQMGFADAVALMGWAMSEEQAAIIAELVSPSGTVWLIPDGDEAGKKCAEAALPRLALNRRVRLIKLDEGKQPTDYSGAHFREWLGR